MGQRIGPAGATLDGQRATLVVERAVHRDATGRDLFTVDTTLFFPGAKPAQKDDAQRAKDREKEKAEAPRVPAGARLLARWRTGLAASRAYTAVSGDYNPVHISPLAAWLLGFRGAFVHGYATKARVAHRVVHELCAGDPTQSSILKGCSKAATKGASLS